MGKYKAVEREDDWCVQIEDRFVSCSTEKDAILVATALNARETEGAVGYAYYSKSSGSMYLVDNPKFFNLPHVFPIYSNLQQPEETILNQ